MLSGILRTRGVLAVLWLAIILLGAYRCFDPIPYDPKGSAPMTEEAVRMGHSLYKHEGFSNPYQTLDTGPTAHTAPGFPVLVAAVYRVFGDGARGAYALKMTDAAVVLLQIALLPVVMQMLGAGLLTGLLAAFIAVMGV